MVLSDDHEGPLLSSWGRWRESFSKDENEECLNPLYYIFGSGDDYCTTGPLPLDSEHFNNVLKDTPPKLSIGGSYGLYRNSSVKQSKDDPSSKELGFLMPETSMCSMRLWEGFFLRYIPQLMEQRHHRLVVQRLESRLVRDVQKLKEELNELELSVGSFTTDLTSFIGDVLVAREEEIRIERKLSVDSNVPFRPRLSAVLVTYEEEEGEREGEGNGNTNHEQTDGFQRPASKRSLPTQFTSLAQFTDALYTSELEDNKGQRPKQLSGSSPRVSGTPGSGGRSPVTKTRLRVTKEDPTSPSRLALRWKNPPMANMDNSHTPPLEGKATNKKDSGVLEESLNELTEL